MRRSYQLIMIIILFCLPLSSFAKWQCTSYDANRGVYIGISHSPKSALKKSLKMCLQMSSNKRSCTITMANYRQMVPPLIHCTVRDARGKSWSAHAPHACAKAIAKCRTWHMNRGLPNGGICIVD